MQPAGLLEITPRERVERDLHHLLAALAHVDEALHHRLLRVEVARELRELRDRDALVAHALDVQPGVEQREHETKVGRDRRLAREHELDLLLERVVAIVDLVVESDDLVAELDILRAQGVDDATDGAEDDLAGFLEPRLEGVQLSLELDSHPNLPVT